MKILLSSYAFAPSLGGIEQISGILADKWRHLGQDVRVLTCTPDPSGEHFDYPVHRRPSTADILKHLKWCDVHFQNNISLNLLWPAAIVRRPIVITYQTWLSTGKKIGFLGRLKQGAGMFATKSVAVSNALKSQIIKDSTTIPNPYREDTFTEDSTLQRTFDLVFLGRLVSDKGCDLLLEALRLLRTGGCSPSLTIIGRGEEEKRLRAKVFDYKLDTQVRFAGPLQGELLAKTLNQHRIIVIPSRWDEPFGIVALEAIACGCVAVGSQGGGLPDAIGPCGLLFPNGNVKELARQIERLLESKALVDQLKRNAPGHLISHTGQAVASKYLDLFRKIVS